MCANRESSVETTCMCWLVQAFTSLICAKNHFQLNWLINSGVIKIVHSVIPLSELRIKQLVPDIFPFFSS